VTAAATPTSGDAHGLYPEIEPDACGHLDVGDGHRVWWEACGKPDGVPVIFLHGGPGGASRPRHRRFFDPGHFRFVTMHQRGCGLSTPLGETRANTTQALVADIERLRAHLGFDRWLVVGGSWGTALGIAYGEAHPDACLGFVLMGVTLGRAADSDWWWNGTRMLFPEAWDAMIAALPPGDRADPVAGFDRLLKDPDPAVHLPAATRLALFSAATTATQVAPETLALYEDASVVLPLARFFVHYTRNGHFFAPGELLSRIGRIAHLPCVIQVSRYDVTTPVEPAWTLHKAWPGSQFKVVAGGAHSLADEPVARALLASIESAKAWAQAGA